MSLVRQSGGVVLLGGQVALRRTAMGEYLFPKGHIEPGEGLEQTALREVAEELGLEAEILAPLAEVEYRYQGDDYRVLFYLMRTVKPLPEWEDHLREDAILVSRDQVAGLLSFESYRSLWKKAEEWLRAHPSGPHRA